MKKYKLDDMKGGWFVGNFEPSVMKADFEVGIHRHKKGVLPRRGKTGSICGTP